MKNGRIRRFAAVGMLAVCSLFGTGCTLQDNFWWGFGTSLGAVPANLIANYITGTFFGLDGTTE